MQAQVFFSHIPKCMGTTVLDFLKSRYDTVYSHAQLADAGFPASAWSVHHSLKKVYLGPIREDWVIADKETKDINIDVVHGHIPMSIANNTMSSAKRVTFVRNPVERVISHYRYYRKHGMRGCHLITLQEFAVRRCNQNVISLFLQNAVPDFVGFTEYPDLIALAQFLSIEPPQDIPILNATPKDATAVTQSDIDFITRINMKDVELYNSLLSMYNRHGG